ncbi:MAG TPA: hypothetical protein VGP36_13620 [Mycobacteriales bacterium]|nr:hypothetical protein [Mycobacteriales bacterium]
MSTPIPPPLRAAAGLAALAIDSARKVPRQLVGLPVLAVSTALQASLKAQQTYAGLVARGDEVLTQLRGQQEGAPPWAQFDDEPAGARPPSAFDAVPEPPDAADDVVTEDLADSLIEEAGEEAALIEAVERELDPDFDRDVPSIAEERAEQAEADAENVLGEIEEDQDAAADAALAEAGVTVADFEPGRAGPERVNGRPPGSGTEPGADLPGDALVADAAAADAALAGGPLDGYLAVDPPVAGYDGFSIPQLRGRLRSLTIEQVEALVAYERANQARPAYLTMLENRLTTLRSR